MTTIKRTGPQGTPLSLTRQRQVQRGRFLFDNMDWHEYFNYDNEAGRLVWKRRPLSHFKRDMDWRAWNTRRPGKLAGRVVKMGRKWHPAYRIIWEMHNGPIPHGMVIDHIDCCRTNDRLCNLRLATPAQNSRNYKKRSHSTHALKGVSFDKKSKRWSSRIRINGIYIWLGSYASQEEAHLAYCRGAKKYHGEFARTE